jgi:hypothetical protein
MIKLDRADTPAASEGAHFVERCEETISTPIAATPYFEKTLSGSRRFLSIFFRCTTLRTEETHKCQNGGKAEEVHCVLV